MAAQSCYSQVDQGSRRKAYSTFSRYRSRGKFPHVSGTISMVALHFVVNCVRLLGHCVSQLNTYILGLQSSYCACRSNETVVLNTDFSSTLGEIQVTNRRIAPFSDWRIQKLSRISCPNDTAWFVMLKRWTLLKRDRDKVSKTFGKDRDRDFVTLNPTMHRSARSCFVLSVFT